MAPVVEKAFYMINSPPSIKHDVTCNLNGEGGGAACDASRLESIFRHRLIVLFRTHIFPTSRRQRPASSHLLQVPAAAKNVEKTQKPIQGWLAGRSQETRLKRCLVYRAGKKDHIVFRSPAPLFNPKWLF